MKSVKKWLNVVFMKIVESIQFSLFSPEQIRKMSAAKITVPDTYDEDGYPINGGLADQRLGVIDPGLKCKSCGGRMKDCSGHFGHIELVRPVVHVGFARTVYQLLRSCCRKCGRLMTTTSLEKITRSSECPHCGEPQKQVSFVKPTSYYEEDRKLLPSEVRERLERIPDEDLRALGVAIRPEWMVLTVLPVPPVTTRPSITLETGERSEDDLTHKLVDILRINQRLEENVDAGAPQLIIEDLWELLQYHVTTFFDNETAGVPPARHRSGRQLKTLFQRLKGKEGRFRYNLSGKRVNFSARTVISPDPMLSINELGVPDEIARELSVPVSVTEWNSENIRKLVRANPEKINYVIRPDGRRKKLTQANLEEVLGELAPGYIVERQLMDGDVVIFNRQPSLHRVSMMCHRIRVLPGKTFRFNVAVCTPYNADFDGDEMNIHVPQNEEAQSEADILMSVESQLLSPRSGDPIIAPDLDQITGLFLLTFSPELVFPREDACSLLDAAGIEAEVKRGGMSGRELFSLLLPEGFEFEARNKACVKCANCKEEKCAEDAFFRVRKGKLVSGHFDSKINGLLVKELFTNYGSEATRKYIDAASRISVALVTRFGLSLSLDDYHVSLQGRKEVSALYKNGRKELRELVRKYRSKRLERQPGKTQKETLEEHVMNAVEAIRHNSWKSVRKNIKTARVSFNNIEYEHNNALLMAGAGVKSRPINVVQMAALVGQQAVRGKRMTSGYYQRILPHYHVGDLGGEARGFVRSSYCVGLTPTEYFFHAAGGRDSVVDKGVNPAKTGYMQRRLINAMQDFVVAKDLSVRDATGQVIQFVFGDDARDPSSGGGPIAYGEAVGVVAAQSLGEPSTQMSVAADEKVLVNVGGTVKSVAIGEFVDSVLSERGWRKVGGADVADVAGLPAGEEILVPSMTREGKIAWKKLVQCSRHDCRNKILELTTRSGRRIRATANHSFVARKKNALVPVLGSELRRGDRIPVVKNLPVPPVSSVSVGENLQGEGNEFLDLGEYLPKETHWFGSEFKKALESFDALGLSRESKAVHNVSYAVPVGLDALRHYANHENSFEVEEGFVYPVQNHSRARIPETLALDFGFGWFVGAFLSEGSLSKYQVGISNTDREFLSRVKRFADALRLRYSEKDNLRGFAKGRDLTINSALLSELLRKTCGKGCANKRVPDFAFNAGDEFVSALLSAYFDGDGNVSVERKCIRASSASRELIDGIALLLARFGIFCTKHSSNPRVPRIPRKNGRTAKAEHRLWISGRQAARFKEKIGFGSAKKKALLEKLCAAVESTSARNDLDVATGFGSALSDAARKLGVPSRLVNKFTKKQRIGKATLRKYVRVFEEKSVEKKVDVSKETALLTQLLDEDVVWDEIIEIKTVNSTPKVYDFAVQGLETFTTFDGVITHNTLRTFHYAGVASLAQLGFTRMVEIVDARKTPKKPVMEIYLQGEASRDYEKAKAVAASIERVSLGKAAKIEEDFVRKIVLITLDRQALRDKGIPEKLVLQKIGEVAPEYARDGAEIKIKVKDDSLKNIRKMTTRLSEIILKGVQGINRVIVIEKKTPNGPELSLATEGTNLKAVLKVPGVDASRTTTNDIMEIARVLGIEAARNAIIHEIKKVLAAQDLRIDLRHVSLIADAMTFTGEVRSVGRHGIAGEKSSVLARAAFEETAKHLVRACVFGEEDKLRGIAENIIIGQTIPCGTGRVSLVMKSD